MEEGSEERWSEEEAPAVAGPEVPADRVLSSTVDRRKLK